MKYWRWFVTIGFVALSLSGCNKLKSPGEIGKQAGESLVLINYEDQPGHGSGFFVHGENKKVCTILTVRHVIPPSGRLQLQTSDQKIWKDASITSIKRFSKQDLAVVTFKPNGRSCPYKSLSLGNSDKVSVGETIYITGFPGSGLSRQFTVGTVSLIDNQTEGYGISYTAITAAGMSGAPVMNTVGEVVAVHGRTDVELSRQAELKGEEPPPQQQSTTGANSTNGDAVGTFKWGIPINTYVANLPKISTEAVAESNASKTTKQWIPETAEQWLALGNDSYFSKRYEEAITAYDRAIQLKPDYAVAFLSQGKVLEVLQRHEDAISSYDKAIAIKPDYSLAWYAWYGRGYSLRQLQRYEAALASYDRAISIKPDDSSLWSERGAVLLYLKRYKESLTAYDQAIQIKPDSTTAWYGRGIALVHLKRYKEAIASCDKAIQLNGEWADRSPADAWGVRGSALSKLQRYSDAIASYDKAIAIKPDFTDAWNNRGITLSKLQRYTDAIASYDKAIALKPDLSGAWHDRGVALFNLNRYQEAIESFDKAISIKPDDVDAWNGQGAALANLNRYEEALKSFDKALSIQPDYQLAINNRKQLLKQLRRSK